MGVRICLGCMREIGDVERCPHCGFSREDVVLPNALKPKTVLHSRYVVGKLLSSDGEGNTYIGFDCNKECAIYLREYMPDNLCAREEETLIVEPGCDAKFKALKSDFLDLYQNLGELNSLENIIRVYDLFEENNTVYAVYLKYDAVPLSQYIREQAGELSWKQASELFKPIFESLAVIHTHGVIHRGISPETLMVTLEGKLILTGFEICAARVQHSELRSKIYEGYAAPEQYARMTPHGEWTDVYGLCAVLYKTLSGTMPPEANTRAVNDNLIPLVELNETVPLSVSLAVERGLTCDYRERTGNIRGLVSDLYHEGNFTISMDAVKEEATQYYDAAKKRPAANPAEKEPNGGKPGEKKEERPPIAPWKRVVLLCLPFVLLIAFLLYWVMVGFGCKSTNEPADDLNSAASSELTSDVSETESVSSDSSVSSEAAADLIEVDNFIDMNISEIQNNPMYDGKYSFVVEAQELSGYEEGTVVEQSIAAGTKVERGAELKLIVVTVPELTVTFPALDNLQQMTKDNLISNLRDDLHIPASKFADPVEQSHEIVPKGNVINIEGPNGIQPGAEVPLEDIQDGSITIYYSSGPAQQPEPEESTEEEE